MMTATSWRGDTGRGNLVTATAENKQPWTKEDENTMEVMSGTTASKLWNSLSAFSIRLSICFLKISELKSSLKRLCNPQLKRENTDTGRLCYYYCQYSLNKVKPCLTNLVAPYDEVTTSVNREELQMLPVWTAVRLLTVSQNILSKLEKYQFDGWAFQWIRNWLDGHIWRTVVNALMYKQTSVTSCVSQGPYWDQ